MGFLKAKGVSVTVAEREFEISFNMNVVEAIFEKFGALTDFQKALRGSDACGNLRTTIWILSVMINDAIEEENERSKEKSELLSERQLGRLLPPKDFFTLRDSLFEAWIDSMPKDDKPEDESEEASPEVPAETDESEELPDDGADELEKN
jgi:hypothetical protein